MVRNLFLPQSNQIFISGCTEVGLLCLFVCFSILNFVDGELQELQWFVRETKREQASFSSITLYCTDLEDSRDQQSCAVSGYLLLPFAPDVLECRKKLVLSLQKCEMWECLQTWQEIFP